MAITKVWEVSKCRFETADKYIYEVIYRVKGMDGTEEKWRETGMVLLPKPDTLIPWDTIKDVDCSFTSPPYFSTEEYNKGGDKEENQSWFKFNEYEKWRDDFFLPVSKKCFEVSKHTLINIMDPTIKGKRYKSCDEVVDMLKDNFVGQIGMRIMQRPKSDKLFETEKDKQEFMNKTFIENVWCFSKDKNVDLFKSARKGTLDSFFE